MEITPGSSIAVAGETIGGLVIAALVAISGAQLFWNANSANRHVKDGIALAAAPSAPEDTGGRSSNAIAAGYIANAPSRQVFALLSTYYAANISQGNTIFWASLLSMSIGFAIIFVGVLSAGPNGVTAIVAAIAGVLSQFIAATFLVVLRSTQQQGTTYVQTLVELRLRDLARASDQRGVDLGLRLLGEISADRSNPANSTKAAIAMGLIVKAAPATIEPPAVTVTVPPPSDDPVIERRTRSGIVTFDESATPEPIR